MRPNWKTAQDAYPVNDRWVWLNNCGTTPTGRHIVARMHDYFTNCAEHGPGPSEYSPIALGHKLKTTLARLLHADADEIALVHNTAEAMHMVSLGLDLAPGDEILVLADEYPSNVYPWQTVNPLQAGVMRTVEFRACWAHGEERKFGSAIVKAKAAATGSVAQGGSEPS
jgi:selenocysteine lyase/cysteine desulfurase